MLLLRLENSGEGSEEEEEVDRASAAALEPREAGGSLGAVTRAGRRVPGAGSGTVGAGGAKLWCQGSGGAAAAA